MPGVFTASLSVGESKFIISFLYRLMKLSGIRAGGEPATPSITLVTAIRTSNAETFYT